MKSSPSDITRQHHTQSEFPATPWTMLALSSGDETQNRRALEQICALYWAPLYAFARRSGLPPAEAEDAAQGFFLHLLERGTLHRADQHSGRLRSYLIGALKHFLTDEFRRQSTRKRGGRLLFMGDPAALEAQLAQTGRAGETPDEAYERRWAVSILTHAISRLKEEEIRAGRGPAFAILEPYLVRGTGTPPQSEAAAALGISQNALSVAVHRMRKRFQTVFRSEVAATVGGEQEVDAEIAHLRSVFLKD